MRISEGFWILDGFVNLFGRLGGGSILDGFVNQHGRYTYNIDNSYTSFVIILVGPRRAFF